VSATETAAKGVRAPALGHEHPHPARPHRRESAGRIGPQTREALDVASHECGRETDRAVDRPERCAPRLFLIPSLSSEVPDYFVAVASIFKRMSDVPDLDYNTSQDFTAAYKVRNYFSSTLFYH